MVAAAQLNAGGRTAWSLEHSLVSVGVANKNNLVVIMNRLSFAFVALSSSILLVNGASSSHPDQGDIKAGGVLSGTKVKK